MMNCLGVWFHNSNFDTIQQVLILCMFYDLVVKPPHTESNPLKSGHLQKYG